MAAQFRSNLWDPVLIVSQIIAIQCTYYVGLGVWILIFDFWMGSVHSLHQIFSDKAVDYSTTSGRLGAIAFILNSVFSSIGLWYIVGRAKQCLDFAATATIVHLVFCTFYLHHIPGSWTWWIVNIVCLAITSVLGEFACMRTEMKAIPISTTTGKSNI
ncbi:protein SYS1 homolog [Dendronephthya gigantea]|uniref:protein SYS1 homolog n=1 Tax=Dendronephthya gigantea TaxID=151771 RepID=UPI00106AA907|nr:protein SYS1 homolog [Dendronephthya gigantea]